MLRHTKFRPYIRRMRPGDTSDDLRVRMRLAFYQVAGWEGYVLVQRGFRHHVIDVARTRREVMKTPAVVALGIKPFKTWAKEAQTYARGKK